MMQGDFNLSPFQRYTTPTKEVLKQTMLNQEDMFRHQVHELHRLYRVQESLMKDFGREECNYNMWNSKLQSSLFPLPSPTSHESLAKRTKFALISKVGTTPLTGQELLNDRQSRRPVSLQLSADAFINLIEEEDVPKKGNMQNFSEGPRCFKLPLFEGSYVDAEDLKLSLRHGGDNRRIAGSFATCFIKKNYYCSQNVIDLEESIESMSDGYPQCGILSKGKHELQGSAFSNPIISTCVKKDPSHEIAESSSFQEFSECCQERTSSNEGIKKFHNDAPSDDLSSQIQHFTSYQEGQLDLNKAHLDDSYCCSDDDMLTYASGASTRGSEGFNGGVQDKTRPTMIRNKDASGCSNKASGLLKQDNLVNLDHMDLNKKNVSGDIWTRNSKDYGITGSEPSLVNPQSMISSSVGVLKDLGFCRGDEKNHNVELKPKLSSEVSCEKSEVDNALLSCTDQSPNTFEDGQGKSPASCKSYCISDNDSSSAKTSNSGITSGVLNQHSNTQLRSQVLDVLIGESEQRISGSSDLQNECSNKEEGSAKMDVVIQEAAELLIHISSERSACDQNSCTKMGSEEMENERKVQPLCSVDSFELIAINLTESNVDDESVSSKPFEITEMESKEFGLKLRRGRRMKDFQREILPSLTSLSRHEILEDINIMEGVLRSREYRKMRAKMAGHGVNWLAPVRSRRSRLSYAGRRKFS